VKIMARIIKSVEIEEEPAMALFDTGALYTYVRSSLTQDAPRLKVPSPPRVVIGGRTVEIREVCFLRGKIEGLDFFTDAVPLDELGKADGYDLDVLIGARTMEQWEIKLDLRTGTLDGEHAELYDNLCEKGSGCRTSR
jgi:hypothetical protein